MMLNSSTDSPLLLWWYWDPPREAFYIPVWGHPVVWYGILFVLGFLLGYWIFLPLLLHELRREFPAASLPTLQKERMALADRLMWYLIIGTLVGARLGHVFFYDWHYYRHHWLDIVKTWEGGLASHGGAIGILIALALFRCHIAGRYPQLTFLKLADLITIPAALAGFFIRIGNFVNQEILGTRATVAWAVVFGHPVDGSSPEPRHPVQLYEAAAYLTIFLLLIAVWRYYKKRGLASGALSGLFFILVFGARILLENYKEPERHGVAIASGDSSWLMGQWLSLPFLLLGILLLGYAFKRGIRSVRS